MYPSGSWVGFWQQTGWGRQAMAEFRLRFDGAAVSGGGRDVVGVFTVKGRFDPANGTVAMRKTYVGAHVVEYVGGPDGEGCILGTWRIEHDGLKSSGPFLMKPNLPRPTGDEEIREIRKP